MAPENANIFFLDDDVDYLEAIKDKLEKAGHSVPLVAHTRDEAEKAIPLFEAHHINVAVLDKRLVVNDEKNVDGEHIGRQIRNTHPEVTIVGNSSKGLACADVNVTKNDFQELLQTVKNA